MRFKALQSSAKAQISCGGNDTKAKQKRQKVRLAFLHVIVSTTTTATTTTTYFL